MRGIHRIDNGKLSPVVKLSKTRRHSFRIMDKRFWGDLENTFFFQPSGWLESGTHCLRGGGGRYLRNIQMTIYFFLPWLHLFSPALVPSHLNLRYFEFPIPGPNYCFHHEHTTLLHHHLMSEMSKGSLLIVQGWPWALHCLRLQLWYCSVALFVETLHHRHGFNVDPGCSVWNSPPGSQFPPKSPRCTAGRLCIVKYLLQSASNGWELQAPWRDSIYNSWCHHNQRIIAVIGPSIPRYHLDFALF